METKRQQKFARTIQKELGTIFQREGTHFLPNVFTTITKVTMTPDLGLAKVMVSFFNCDNTALALNTIKAHAAEIRYQLGNHIRNQVRVIPQLEFYVDDTNEYVDKIEKLFAEIHKNDSKDGGSISHE